MNNVLEVTQPVLGGARRVLLLTQDLQPWGAQRQLVDLAIGLARNGHDVRVGALECGGPLTAELIAHHLPVEAFGRRWRWDLSPIPRLAAYLRRNAIDIVHSFMFLPNFYARFAGKLARTPAVVSSLRSTGIEGWPRYALDIATCFMCDAMIANSAAGATHYTRRGGLRNRTVIIRNGFRLRRTPAAAAAEVMRVDWGLTRFPHLVGMVGAMEWRKDQQLLIRAMQSVVASEPGTGLVLAGDGSRRRSLEALARSLGLESHIVFLGTVRQPELLYPLLDVYVQASFEGEGISNSILEAMAHSLPVIATDVGGNREVVVDGETGHIVPQGDGSRLTATLLGLLSDPGRRRHMGEAGDRRVRTVFSIDAMVTATQKLYERLLVGRTAHASAQKRESPQCSSLAS